ncbi:two-component sensor histidine kinase [Halomonas qaidamensis]|uniref:histidine kinase n=1 Tax=Halomonas qaidamensis TaxID=2866211 RepID=A0ABY6JM61_9GAMM|nr:MULTISPECIES: ATP-binding protein [Halomonas]UYV18114.1 two-component sensor histidine kinase [Halomonas qaidamensis]
MSLRARLLLTLGVSLALLWGVAAAWLLSDLEKKFVETLDQRLAQSARMVAGLVLQLPEDVWEQSQTRSLSIPPIEGLACQVHSPRGDIIARTHANMDTILAPGERGHAYRQEGDTTWRVFTYERGDLVITTADRMDERDMLLSDVFRVAVVPFVVALTGSLIALWVVVWRGLAPLSRLRESLASRHPEALAPVSTYGVPKEIKPLIDTLNGLLVRIQQTIVREQRFTNDAAHELRTPLTAIKTHLQVAQRAEGDVAKEALRCAEAGVVRLAHTLDQLLTLARVEGRMRFDDGEPSQVAEIVEFAIADSVATAGQCQPPAHVPHVCVAMPRELAITALRNLLDNALHHGADDLPVVLTVQPSPDQRHVTFTVHDQGSGVDEATLKQLTQRFWRVSKQQGSGLGLAIVAAIVERFGGWVSFENVESGGFSAHLSIPILPDPILFTSSLPTPTGGD